MVKTIKKTERGENYETKHRFKRRFQTGGGNSSRRKKLAAIVSSVLAGAMLLTGTFAWSSISQRATNPIQGTPPPIEEGGRIHDHFNGSNKDVFAENFGESPLFVRIQLREFLEFSGVSQVGTGALRNDYMTWPVHNPTGTPANIGTNTNGIGNYMSWTMGGQSTFMPTFNHQTTGNGGLQTEASGRAIDYITGGSTAAGANNGSANFWNVNQTLTGTVSLDGGGSSTRTHVAGNTIAPRTGIANNGVITVAQWDALGRPVGNFWVIDEDGWAYWANFLMPGTATSLLLDAIHPNMPNNVDWYYAIHVIGEFATADSLGDWVGSPFGAPSDDAEDLIDLILAQPRSLANILVGDNFVDDAGIEWRVLYRVSDGHVLAQTYHVLGAGAMNAPYVGLQWNTVNQFDSWNVAGPANNRLTTFWSEIGSNMRAIARPVHIPADFRTVPSSVEAWATSRSQNPEFTELELMLLGSTGISAPTSGIANNSNALFNLSIAETTRYMLDNRATAQGVATRHRVSSGGTGYSGTVRSWYTRSPGDEDFPVAHLTADAGIATRARGSATTARGIRPALWVLPQ